MFLLLGSISMRGGNNERAIELFKRAEETIPFQQCPYLVAISLVSYFFRVFLHSHLLYSKDVWMGL